MPQINEYLPQTEAQGAIGSISANIELAGAAGRGLERLGSAVEGAGTEIQQRTAQEETSDVYSEIADKRAYWSEELSKRTQDGTLDPDKFKEEFDNDLGGLQDRLTTPQAQNAFERAKSRTGATLLQHAVAGRAQIAKNVAMGSFQNFISKNSLTLQNDPSQLDDIHSQSIEYVDSLVENGGLPASMKDKTVQQMGKMYVGAAVDGYAKINPSYARQLLDSGSLDKTAGGDELLDADYKRELYGRVNTYEHAQEVTQSHQSSAIERAYKTNEEALGQKWLPQLQDNTLTPKAVMDQVQSGALDWEKGNRWIHMIDEASRQDIKTNPHVKADLIQRIVDPTNVNPITDANDLLPYVGKGISITDLNQLNGLYDKTPEGLAMKQGEKALLQSAKSTIRFKNPMTQQYDPAGEQKYAQFMVDYAQAKKQARSNNDPIGDLVDPSSKAYFGNKLNSYQTPLQEQMSQVSQDRTNKALGLRPSGENPDQKQNKNVRQPNESAADYLKRRGLGG